MTKRSRKKKTIRHQLSRSPWVYFLFLLSLEGIVTGGLKPLDSCITKFILIHMNIISN